WGSGAGSGASAGVRAAAALAGVAETTALRMLDPQAGTKGNRAQRKAISAQRSTRRGTDRRTIGRSATGTGPMAGRIVSRPLIWGLRVGHAEGANPRQVRRSRPSRNG